MNRPTSGAARLLRAALLSSLVVALAAGAHALAGGTVPSVLALAGLTALVLPVAVVVTARRVRAVAALTVLGAGQVALHAAFGLAERCGAALGGQVPGDAGGPHGGHVVASSGHACVSHVGAHASGAMIAAHAAATVVTALLVAGAERGLWRVLASLAPLLRPARLGVGHVVARPVVVSALTAPPAALHLRVPPPRRGPPVLRSFRRPFVRAA
ncbi:hypothetical protein [Cellulomonas sp.]|uniref:hypothetical protein n=1 Tax=Cellulomonas sp. TaxID=40001 RepID=UPI00258624F7|nr:hypothetical protein [Cellulomonas sp.]MCR6690327.1 hypothetical protein [Cellulomonas sp.]